MPLYAQVIVDINHSNLDRVFEYSIPEEFREIIVRGMRVLAPFGGGNKLTEGFVIGTSDVSAYDSTRLKAIVKPMESYSVLLDCQLELAKWMKEQYNCLLVDALRLMIPAQLRGQKVREKTVRVVRLMLDEEGLEQAFSALMSANGECKAPQQKRVLQLLASAEDALGVKELYEFLPGCQSALGALMKKGHVEVFERSVLRRPYKSVKNAREVGHKPTTDQQRVINEVNEAMERGEGQFLLKGVTGSGKTEVYMRCISRAMEMGKSAIMLVPEISLTPQTVDRFRSRFGDAVAVLHSRLSYGERYDEWRRIRLGKVSVVVGARSAIFAPFERLGLIVIDEEHESSYISGTTPRYSAGEIAAYRCKKEGAALLMGSATPSLESYYRSKKGEFTLLKLDERINGKPLPEVEVVNMCEELEQGNRSIFSSPLYREMKKCFVDGMQMMLFLNRRGYSTFVSCRGCGYVFKCTACDVSLTYHKTDGTVRCHYCGATHTIPPACPTCGKPYLKHFGVGTQQVEEQVNKYFPGMNVLRMDYDTTRKKDSHLEILKAFADKEAQVLIGTQMIAKGLDFPEVTLVGVIAADATLFVPDFRSAERAFQLVTQVAGRAGRDKIAGKVIVQTYSPEHPSIKFASQHDYENFYEYEIKIREQSEFPPFADFVRFLFAGEHDEAVAEQCAAFRAELETQLRVCMEENNIPHHTLIYLSHHKAPIHLLMGEYRYQVIVKLKRSAGAEIVMALMNAFATAKRSEGFSPAMELNPQNMT